MLLMKAGRGTWIAHLSPDQRKDPVRAALSASIEKDGVFRVETNPTRLRWIEERAMVLDAVLQIVEVRRWHSTRTLWTRIWPCLRRKAMVSASWKVLLQALTELVQKKAVRLYGSYPNECAQREV